MIFPENTAHVRIIVSRERAKTCNSRFESSSKNTAIKLTTLHTQSVGIDKITVHIAVVTKVRAEDAKG